MKKILIMNSSMSELNKEMEKPEFLAALKLVSGEEILAVITSVHDDNGDYLIVENPIESLLDPYLVLAGSNRALLGIQYGSTRDPGCGLAGI